jgi:hypothetical protein
MTPADAIRELGRAEAYRETAFGMSQRPTAVNPRAFMGAWLELSVRARRGLNLALMPEWPKKADPADVRRRAEALARRMEVGEWLAAAFLVPAASIEVVEEDA